MRNSSVFAAIQAGKLVKIRNAEYAPAVVGVSPDGKYIRVRHFGGWAVKNTAEAFEDVVEEIAPGVAALDATETTGYYD